MKTITYNPETHVLVPRGPTEKMQDAIWLAAQLQDANAQYRAMIQAAEKGK